MRMTMNTRERIRRLFDHVYERTMSGDVRWAESEPYGYRAQVTVAEVDIVSVDRDGASPFAFVVKAPTSNEEIYNLKSMAVGSNQTSDVRNEARAFNRKLRDLYETARGQALGFDVV